MRPAMLQRFLIWSELGIQSWAYRGVAASIASAPAVPMTKARLILPLLTVCSLGSNRGGTPSLRSGRPPTKASQQTQLRRPERRNTLPSSRHRKEDSFWSRSFLDVYSAITRFQYMGLTNRIYEDAIRYIRLAANERAGSRQARPLPLSSPGIVGFITEALVCLATRWERRSMRRDENAHVPWLHRQTKQCGRNLSRLRSSASSSDRPISAERYHRPRTLVP